MPRKKKNKEKKSIGVSIKMGFITYNITSTPDGLQCQCSKARNMRKMCQHIKEYLSKKRGINNSDLRFYMRIHKLIAKELLNPKLKILIEDEINEILDSDCSFCCSPVTSKIGIEPLSVCVSCGGVSHGICFRKWAQKGKGCMYCEYGRIKLPTGDTQEQEGDIEFPELK